MSLFEFIMVLESIVVGLGVAKILSGLSHAVLERQVTVAAWQPLLLASLILLTLIQVWWHAWELRSHAVWGFGQLLLILASPVLLYVLAHLAFPPPGGTDLRSHYFDRHRVLFGIVAASATTSMVGPSLAFGDPLLVTKNLPSAVTAGGALVLAASPHSGTHAVLLLAGAAIAAWNIAAGMPDLS